MPAHGIQGMALTIIKVLLRKSSFNKILYIENFFTNYIQSWHDPYWDHETLYPTLSQALFKFQLLILRWWTVSWVSITEEQRWFEPIINPAGNSRPHDICRSPTYIYQPILGSPKTRTGPRHPRTQYSTILAHGHVGTRYSRHLSTPSARVAILVIESPS